MSAVFAILAALVLPDEAGEALYRKHCASCHGPKGEGGKDYPEPLVGDRTLEKLAVYIDKRMPEGAPEKLNAQESMSVAKFIFDAWYSKAAQARKDPPRIDLARLTVGQYRTAVADLLNEAPPPRKDERSGLRIEVFSGKRRFQNDQRKIDKIVPVLDFRPGEKPPAEDVDPAEYSVRWTGSVFAPETGDYEIILETRNGVRLWLNDESKPLIDGWVRSGDLPSHHETVPLLGGRHYPLRVEIFKEKKEKEVAAVLRWKPPHRVEELVPERLLSPARAPEQYVVRTPFPPDDRSMGYERATAISKSWVEAVTEAAFEVAGHAAARFARTDPPGRAKRLIERAFRRPLTPEQQAFYVDRHFKEQKDPELAFKTAILLALKSPRFLYLPAENTDAYDVAARISFALWDSLPDQALLDAAKAGRLATAEGVAKEVERMLPDPRTKAKLSEFYRRWLQLDRLHDLAKDPKRFPGFDEVLVADLRTSLDLFLEQNTWDESGDFRRLLTADTVFMNGRLAKFYGVTLAEDAPFQAVTLDPKKHAGLLTHPLLMAGFSYTTTSSPIHRGVFLARAMLGRRLRAPPEAVTPIAPELHPSLTTRERVILQTKSSACQSCHAMINPLGLALENFDAVGRFRETELKKPIDARGSYWTLGGEEMKFTGPRELGEFLAKSEETHEAFVEHLFHFLVKQPILAHGLDRPELLRADFAKSNFNIRRLLVLEVTAAARPSSKEKRP